MTTRAPGTMGQLFPPAPCFTLRALPDLTGKVIIITGSSSGVGYEHAKLLYSKSATVYVAVRSEEKANKAIEALKLAHPDSKGHVVFLPLDLAALPSIRASAQAFLAKETRLDVLIQNAGVMQPPAGSKAATGHDLEMATNCLGPFLFYRYLENILKQTARTAPVGSVRIVWVASMVTIQTPEGGIQFDPAGNPVVLENTMHNYMQSKVGNIFLASEVAQALKKDNIISVAINPGLMRTELQRHGPKAQSVVMGVLFKGPLYGAYTQMFAAFSPKVTIEKTGRFIIPWGRLGDLPSDLKAALRDGRSQSFRAWCERETQEYLDLSGGQ